jgi:hypothetical protein
VSERGPEREDGSQSAHVRRSGSIAVYGPSAARGDADADRGEPGDGDGDGDGESRRSEGNKRYECRTGTA